MTYKVDLGKFFEYLPHQISGWVLFIKGPDEEWDSMPNSSRSSFRSSAPTPQSTSPSDRFRNTAAQLLSYGKGEFCFGEAMLSELANVRVGTKVALGLKDTSCGQIVAMSKNNKKLSFLVTELFEHRLTSFVQQFNTESSGVWAQAAEQMRQMNPSTMMDMAGDEQMADFAKIAALGSLFRDVADSLVSGVRELRAEALHKLATNAPHALCSVALQVPFDTLVRELDQVIYDAQTKSAFNRTGSQDQKAPRTSSDGQGGQAARGGRLSAVPRLGVLISPHYGPTVASPKGRIRSVLSKAGKMLRWGTEEEFDEWGVDPFDDSTHSSGHSLHGSVHGPGSSGSSFVQADRTWHGSEISEAMKGNVEYSAVPRHGTVPYPVRGSEVPQNITLREGMLDALQLLSAVLGQRFIESYAMPCISGETVDRVHLASLIGKIYYAAASSGSSVSIELRQLHISLLAKGSEQQRVNAIDALADIARLETMEASAHVEECCRLLEESITMAEVPPALLESVVVVIPTLFRLPDEDILHSDVGVRGGAALTHQIQHNKTPQGLHHVSSGLLQSLCSILTTAIVSFQDKSTSPSTGVHIPKRRNSTEPVTGLMLVSGDPAPKIRKSREDNYVSAALAVLRAAGKEQWDAINAPWDALVKCCAFRGALCAGLPLLCRQLAIGPPGTPHGREAIPAAQSYLQSALNYCISIPPTFAANPSKKEVLLWTWKHMAAADSEHIGQTASPIVKLLCQLPSILSAIDGTWPDRKQWVRVMHAAYAAYFADRGHQFEGEDWTVTETQVLIDAEVIKEDTKISDPLALAYQLPAAIRLSKEEKIPWPEAIRLHMYMGFDEAADIRWMISHSIHLMPALLGEECLDVLCETFNKLFADDDVDVAEGIVKNYMYFVRAVAEIDSGKAVPLADQFFDSDPSHWERRLTFRSYQAAQMVLHIESGLCEDGEDKAMASIINLKEHHCPQVRKQVVREMVNMLSCQRMLHKQQLLLTALVSLGTSGKCRQRQSFLWACEYCYERAPKLFAEYLLPALRRIVETKRPGAEGRSLTVGAPALLARVEGRAVRSNANASSEAPDSTASQVTGLGLQSAGTASLQPGSGSIRVSDSPREASREASSSGSSPKASARRVPSGRGASPLIESLRAQYEDPSAPHSSPTARNGSPRFGG